MGSLLGKPEKKSGGKRASSSGDQPKEKAGVTSKDRAVLDLKNARDRLKKYRKKVWIHEAIVVLALQ